MVAAQRKRSPGKRGLNAKAKKPGRGIIHADRAYRIPAFCYEMGITRQRLSDMRERGLAIREDGKYRVIVGQDYLDWLRTLPTGTAADGGQ